MVQKELSPPKESIDCEVLSPDSSNLISFESTGAPPTPNDRMARAPVPFPSADRSVPGNLPPPPLPPRVHRTSSGDPQSVLDASATSGNQSFAHLRQLSWDYGLSIANPKQQQQLASAHDAAAAIDTSGSQITAANPAPITRPQPLAARQSQAAPESTGTTSPPILVPSALPTANGGVPSAKLPYQVQLQATGSVPANAADAEAISRIEQMLAGSYPHKDAAAQLLRRRRSPTDPVAGVTVVDGAIVSGANAHDVPADRAEDEASQLVPQVLPSSGASASNALAIPGHFVRASDAVNESAEAAAKAQLLEREKQLPPHDSFEHLFGSGDAPLPASSEADEDLLGELNATYIAESSDSNAESCTADLLAKARADHSRSRKRANSAEPELSLPPDSSAAAGANARTSSPTGDRDSDDDDSVNSSRLNVSSISGMFKRFVRHSFGVDSDSDDEKQERASINSQRERLTIKEEPESVGDSESSTPTLPRLFKSHHPSASSRRSYRTPPPTPAITSGGMIGGPLSSFAASLPPEAIPEGAENEAAESSASSSLPNATTDKPNGSQAQAADDAELNGLREADNAELSIKTGGGSGSAKWTRRTYAAGVDGDDDRSVDSAFARFSNARDDSDRLADGAMAERGDRRFGGGGGGDRPNKSHAGRHGHGGSASGENSLSIALQVLFPFLIAGFGMVVAGIVLEIVRVRNSIFVHWFYNSEEIDCTRTRFTSFLLRLHFFRGGRCSSACATSTPLCRLCSASRETSR